jgi:hypothetical protein
MKFDRIKLPFKPPHQVIRYIILLGIFAFASFMMQWGKSFTLIFIGPVLYLAFALERFLGPLAGITNRSQMMLDYFYLLPITAVYFGFIGFILKQLLQERGWVGMISLITFIGFVLYIHHEAWQRLTGYFISFPYP